jgi:hypothetical protein
MNKDYQKLFSYLKPIQPPPRLYSRVVEAIIAEEARIRTRGLALTSLLLLSFTFLAMPFSWKIATGQLKDTGASYLLSVILADFSSLSGFWRDSLLALLELLPVTSLLLLALNLAFALFALRLFLLTKPKLLSFKS